MLIILNDIALKFKFSNKYEAIDKIKDLVELILELKKNNINVLIRSNYSLNGVELADGYYFPQLFHETPDVLGRNYQTALKTFLTKCREIQLGENEIECLGMYSKQCAYAYENNGNLLSLQTKEKFSEDNIKCHYCTAEQIKEVTIRNLAMKEQIVIHRFDLPIRKYEFNPKHKINSGWGTVMDLSDEIAQRVLNDAIIAETDPGHLIAKYNGKYYSFRRHWDIYYHGYWDNTMPQNLKNKLDALEQ
jgi:hypothetical protein